MISVLITTLKKLGYDLHLQDEKIKYTYVASGDPPPADKVRPLLDELRKRKEEIKRYLSITSRPYWQSSDGTCRICRTTGAWLSIYNVLVCFRCHPPADPKLVKEWKGTA